MFAPRSLAGRLARPGTRLRRLPLSSRIALGILLVVVLGAVFAPLLTQDPLATGIPARAPGADHWFGTDRAGRDVFARVVHGARYSLVIGLGATLLALVLGSALGALAATSRRLADESVMRTLDVVMSFPPIALAAVLVAVFGPSIPVIIFTIAFVYSPSLARVVRANVLEQYGEDYVAAEQVIGARRTYIVARHVAINCAAPVLVFATVMVADSIIFEASLSFIGAGVQDPDPSWGSVLAYGRQILLSGGWWATLFPGLCVLVTVLALNVLSEGMTDAAASPDRSRTGGTDSDDDLAAASAPVADEAVVDAALTELATRLEAMEPAVPPLAEDAPELLVVRDLSIRFPDRYGDTRVVDGISFTVREGETLGLVGESGCGKSITSLAIMGLLARNAEAEGEIRYRGRDLLKLSPKERRALMGPEIAMVYQDAMSSLNPSVLIGTQLKWLTSRGGTRTPAELLELVGLSPERTLRSYPHELSGGQRQRVLIAMALSRSPRLLIADEPTTALDVTVQAQVVELLIKLRDELGFAMVLVSHDLALVGDLAHRVAVMYAGQVAEAGDTRALLTDPAHHYSRGLLGSVVSLESGAERLHQIRGVVPAPKAFGAGCRFTSRCAAATDLCATTPPPATDRDTGRDHLFACHHPAPEKRSAKSLEGAR
ncbi:MULTISPECIES: dipeptide/oligopeptide/nickel ABC transporter permease/ATP-binding protein [unclassified Streptomyces]|uniref:dipeptide/oligopeptide/nickel ABC transporter permease/ATP-binding protein n=1 Tax=unclassified Streptomyces TaxID=2593676 RepID=UPI0025B34D2F|nr:MULTISPECIES: dipeptide/oligopeptide/nickel ABC transporter permease/ATP-binding protein [unclassified Streptomyces]MDN3244946.1 dipeptide/oligopeptide/nickel ABC transporter permease/ATP-binding protein [Streptomyces sp. ZSW22]MDN3254289.1 dipeptide/oligopeptide/nickel ABC transporter permease/ATP-binding protein [Streptomyces sp. MA25(2023)]